MCGIVGYVSFEDLRTELLSGLRSIAHRGPDAQNSTILSFHSAPTRFLGLGHRRLSVIDVTPGANQPFFSHCGRYVIVYNGEIYNFNQLRKELKLKGYSFRTSSDTEVILNSYIEHGTNCFQELDGIFSIAIYDKNHDYLLLARDFLGVKPLYYTHVNGNLYFASEIKALENFPEVSFEISRDNLYEFLNTGWLYDPDTGFSEIHKLPLSTYGIYRPDGTFSVFSYQSKLRSSKKILPDLLREVVNKQLVSDVPIGLLFSGGLDSSILLVNSPRQLFSLHASYESGSNTAADKIDDSPYCEKISRYLGRKINYVEIHDASSETFESIVDSIVEGTEELISDFTFYPAKEIAHKAADNGYKVMLSGMGADELFFGYPRYVVVKYRKYLRFFMPFIRLLSFLNGKGVISYKRKLVNRLLSFLAEKKFGMAYSKLLGYFSNAELCRLFPDQPTLSLAYEKKVDGLLAASGMEFSADLEKALYLDLFGFLQHNLMVTDKSGMSASVEIRVPLLDSELFSYSQKCRSDRFLFFSSQQKKQLKAALSCKLPRKLVYRPKSGFNPPLDSLICNLGKVAIIDILDRSRLYSYLDKSSVHSLVSDHFERGNDNNTYKLWQLVYLARWLDRWEKV